MPIDKFDINYETLSLWNKELFMFVNHKTAAICWAAIKAKAGLVDVITFDSHFDFMLGFISQGALHKIGGGRGNMFFASKYRKDEEVKHFSEYTEFLQWNPADFESSVELISRENKFFSRNNDNFIDVAFMKAIVGNVSCYYLNSNNRFNAGICDDVNGNDHHYEMKNVTDFQESSGKYILDLDLDFFASISNRPRLCPENKIRKYLDLIKSIGQRKECVGITIALEPDCCGSKQNSLKICRFISEVFGEDIVPIAQKLIENANHR